MSEVVSGGARGVDRLGEQWAQAHSIPVRRFIPDWDSLGRRAGILRNREMACYADALVAVWDGKSPGTSNMIAEALHEGLKVHITVPNASTAP